MKDVQKKTYEISALDVKEVSLVDSPAVPKAKIRLIKTAQEGSLVAMAVGSMPEVVQSLLDSLRKNWDDLDDATKGLALDLSTEMSRVSKATERIDTILKKDFFEGTYTSEDDYLLSDIHYMMGMIQSAMSCCRWIHSALKSDAAKAKVDEIGKQVLPAMISGAILFAQVASEMGEYDMGDEGMSGMLDSMEEVVSKMRKDESTKEEQIKPEKESVPEWAKALMASLETLKTKVESLSTAPTTISSDEKPVPSDEKDTAVDDVGEVDVEVFSEEEIDSLLSGGLDGMEPEEAAAIFAAIEAQVGAATVV